jgi:hypothetical protein
LTTKRKRISDGMVKLPLTLAELKDESRVLVLRHTFEDSVYRAYLTGAMKEILPAEDYTTLESAAFLLGARDRKRVFFDDKNEYMVKGELVKVVFKMCDHQPDGLSKTEESEMKYAKPECVDPSSPMHAFVAHWWREFQHRAVSPGVLRQMAGEHEVKWPENTLYPTGLNGEFVEIEEDVLLTAKLAQDTDEGWLQLEIVPWQ